MVRHSARAPRHIAKLASLGLILAAAGCGNVPSLPALILGGPWKYACGPAKLAGQYCTVHEECASGLYCDMNQKVCSSAFVAKGNACSYSEACAAGLYCKVGPMIGECFAASCSGGACTIGAPLGKSCPTDGSGDSVCGAKAQCVLSSNPKSTCEPRPTLGQSCEGLGTCADALVCDLAKNVCVPPTPVGGPCTIKETCAAGLFCLTVAKELADPAHPGTCQKSPLQPVGAPCIGAICAVGAHCDYSTNSCAKDYPIGASCSQGNECGEAPGLAADCVQGKCVATTKAGAKCWPGPEQRCSGGLRCVSEP